MKHKYGIEMPTLLKHARELNWKNGNTLWNDAWEKEMSNASLTFDINPPGYKVPPGWTETTGHLV